MNSINTEIFSARKLQSTVNAMSGKAYIMNLANNMKNKIYGDFRDFGKAKKLDIISGNMVFRGMDLCGCIMLHVKAPDELIESAPKTFISESRKIETPDFGAGPWGGLSMSTQDFVDIIESEEPGIHQFIKIENATNRKKEPLSKALYIFNILRSINAIDINNSSVEVIHIGGHQNANLPNHGTMLRVVDFNNITLKKDLVSRMSIWCGTPSALNYIFVSESIYEKIMLKKMIGVEFIEVSVK